MNGALARIDYGLPSAPDVLIIASDPRQAVDDVASLEARFAGAVAIPAAAGRLDQPPNFDVVLLEIDDAETAALRPLYARLQDGGESGRFASVVILPFDALDEAFACLDSEAISLLVAPVDAMERRVAIAAALPKRGPLHVFDGGTDTGGTKVDLRDEVARIARKLAALAAAEPAQPRLSPTDDVTVDAAFVRGIIRGRRLRDQYFAPDLFADPAWDMLLDLVAARLEHRDVAVSSLCIAAAVPPTTALRWIKILTDAGLFVRRADPADKRRIFIALADEAADAMLCYLAAVQRTGLPLI